MAYMPQETKKQIAAALKKVIPQSWKYSLAVRDHSTIVLTITRAPVDLMALINANSQHARRGYAQLSNHGLIDNFKGDDSTVELFGKILECLKGPDYYDNSDSQTDYFDISHYIRVNVGKYDKPFEYDAPARAQSFPYAAWKSE
jgi:hypothetical protein